MNRCSPTVDNRKRIATTWCEYLEHLELLNIWYRTPGTWNLEPRTRGASQHMVPANESTCDNLEHTR